MTREKIIITTDEQLKEKLAEIKKKGEAAKYDIQIHGNILNDNNVSDCIQFLKTPEAIHCRLQVEPVSSDSDKTYNRLFDALFRVNQRESYQKESGVDLSRQSRLANLVAQPTEAKLRKAKVDMVKGKGSFFGLQVQQQKQQQQQQQTTGAVKKKTTRVLKPAPVVEKEHLGKDNLLPAPSVLVNKHNIHRLMGDAYHQMHPNAKKRPDLGKIWDALVGKGADEIKAANRKITDVDQQAMEKIIAHYHEFSYGLVLDNLPSGFYLQRTEDKQILRYSTEPQFQQKKTLNPLTLQIDKPAKAPLPTYEQLLFIRLKQRDPTTYDTQVLPMLADKAFAKTHHNEMTTFHLLFDKKSSVAKKKEVFWSFFKELTPELADVKSLEALCHALDFEANHYKALGGVLMNQGGEGVIKLLNQLNALHEKGFYTEFNRVFLADSDDYQAFMTPEGLDNLQYLEKMDFTQRLWWESLVKQHQEAGNSVDFNELCDAYRYFLTELKALGLAKLPLSCPFTPIQHMKTALDRALYIVKNAADPQEQLACLNGLDFSAQGAYMAIRYDHYTTVTEAMRLSPSTQKEILLSPDKKDPTHLDYTSCERTKLFNNMGQMSQRDAMMECFYRFVAQQDRALPIETYQEIEQLVWRDQQLSAPEMSSFLSVIALATTNETTVDNPIDEAVGLLVAMSLLKQANSDVNIFDLIKELLTPSFRADSEIHLSLQEMKLMVDLLYASTISLDIKPRMLTILINISELLRKSPSPDDKKTTIQLLNNLTKRSKNPKHPMHNYLLSLGDYIFIDKNFTQNDLYFFSVVTLLDIEFSSDVQKKQNEINKLYQAFQTLSEDNKNLLLSSLNEINLEQSRSLPSSHQVMQIIDAMNSGQIRVKAPITSASKAFFLDQLRSDFPNTTFGTEPTDQSLASVVKLMRGYVLDLGFKPAQLVEQALGNDSNIVKGITSIPVVGSVANVLISEIKKQVEPAIQEITTLLDYLKANENPDISEVMRRYDAVEEKLFALIKTPLITIPLYGGISIESLKEQLRPFVVQFGGQAVETYYDQVFEKGTLLFLIEKPLEHQFKSSLSRAIHSLHTGNKAFDDHLIDYLGNLTLSRPLKGSLGEYNKRFNEANDFVNQLIQIKNRDPIDYRKVMDIFAKNTNDTLLTPKQFSQLLAALNQQKNLPVSRQLTQVVDLLNAVTKTDLKKVDKALAQLDALAKYQSVLTANAYELLLKLSFQHHLSADSVFPIQDIVQLKAIQNLDEEKSKALFNSLMDVLEHVQSTPDNDKLVSEMIQRITACIQEHLAKHPQVTDLITLLLTQCDKEVEASQLSAIHALLGQIPQENKGEWLMVMAGVKHAPIDKLTTLAAHLSQHREHLPRLASLFQYSPCPSVDALNAACQGGAQEVEQFIQHFDKDPKNGRSQKGAIEAQFATDRVLPVVTEIKQILGGTTLSGEQQHHLTQQLMCIHAIGQTYPLTVGKQTCRDLTQASRAELRQYSDDLVKALRQGDPKAREANQLKLLAVMREMYFRSTGKFPRITQMLSLLLSCNYPDNVLMQINTGEGKGITTALLAALQWVNGGTVDVCTANRGLVVQDYNEKGNVDFFNAMGIPSAVVRADSEYGTYKPGGINYSTVADLSLYRARAHLENELLDQVKGKKVATDLVLDESDYTLLDDRTLFNYAVGADGGGDTTNNPYAWIYPHINEFINQAPFKHLVTQEGVVWTREEDIQKLKVYLNEKASHATQKNQLMGIPDKKFDQWLNAACAAQQLVAGQHFILGTEEREIEGIKRNVSIAVPLIQNIPQQGASFSDGVQQFLHARLQKEDPKKRFPQDAEMMFVSTESAKHFADYYYKSGRMVAITGTGGTQEELIEQQFKFGMVAFSIPPYETSKRHELDTVIKKTTEEQFSALKKALNEAELGKNEGKQPTLLICKDINQVREIAHRLQAEKGLKFKVNVVTGEETEAERLRLIDEAGQPNTITIATSLLGRGTDIVPKHSEGLLAIQFYLDKDRDTQQIIGRAGRNGKAGYYQAIYVENGLLHQYSSGKLHQMSQTERRKVIHDVQRHMNEEAAIERHYLQEVDAVKQILLQQFDQWHHLIQEVYIEKGQEVPKEIKEKLLLVREGLINGLGDQWKQQLEASDPQKKYANPYVRRDAKGKLQTEALDKAVEGFQEDTVTLWSEANKALQDIITPMPLDEVNQFRVQCLKELDVSAELKTFHFNARQEKKQRREEQKRAAQHTRYALDVDQAVLKYSDDIPDEEKKIYEERSLMTQLGWVSEDMNRAVGKLACKKESKTLLRIQETDFKDQASLVTAIIRSFIRFNETFSKDLAAKAQMQSVLLDFLSVFEKSQASESQQKQMDVIKRQLIDEVKDQLIADLEQSLSWAKQGNQSWDYWIERDSVKTAALDILKATAALKAATTDEEKQEQIKNLYKVLHKEAAKLEAVWIFSFGHKNTRTLIQHSLKWLDSFQQVTRVSGSFKQEAREEAVRDLFIEKFNKIFNPEALKKIPVNGINALINEVERIKQDNQSVYVAYELKHCLDRFRSQWKESISNDQFTNLLFHTMNQEFTETIQSIEKKHPDQLKESHFFAMKEADLQKQLEKHGAKIKHVSLERGHTGFSSFYHLVIRGEGIKDDAIPGFTRHNQGLLAPWQEKQCQLQTEQSECKEKGEMIGCYLTSFRGEAPIVIDDRLMASTKNQIMACNQHLVWVKHNGLAKEIQSTELHPLSDAVKNMQAAYTKLEALRLAELDQKAEGIPDELKPFLDKKQSLTETLDDSDKTIEDLKIKLAELQKAREEDSKKTGLSSWWATSVNFVVETIGFADSVESVSEEIASQEQKKKDQLKQFEELNPAFDEAKKALLTELDTKMKALLNKELEQQLGELKKACEQEQTANDKKLKVLEKKEGILRSKIEKETLKTEFASKKFSSLEAVLAFESDLRKMPVEKMPVAPAFISQQDMKKSLQKTPLPSQEGLNYKP